LLLSGSELLFEKPEKNVSGSTRLVRSLFCIVRVSQVYSGATKSDVNRLVMWFAERDSEKRGMMESSKMMLMEILR
jgi:hypothetical protein